MQSYVSGGTLASLDPAALSNHLGAIRSALAAHRPVSFDVERPAHDREHTRLATQLRSLVTALRGRPALQGTSFLTVNSTADIQGTRVHAIVQQLTTSWSRHIHGKLGLRKSMILRDLLEMRIPSLL